MDLPQDVQARILCKLGISTKRTERKASETVWVFNVKAGIYAEVIRGTIKVEVKRAAPWIFCKASYNLMRQPEHFAKWWQETYDTKSPVTAKLHFLSQYNGNCSLDWLKQVRFKSLGAPSLHAPSLHAPSIYAPLPPSMSPAMLHLQGCIKYIHVMINCRPSLPPFFDDAGDATPGDRHGRPGGSIEGPPFFPL